MGTRQYSFDDMDGPDLYDDDGILDSGAFGNSDEWISQGFEDENNMSSPSNLVMNNNSISDPFNASQRTCPSPIAQIPTHENYHDPPRLSPENGTANSNECRIIYSNVDKSNTSVLMQQQSHQAMQPQQQDRQYYVGSDVNDLDELDFAMCSELGLGNVMSMDATGTCITSSDSITTAAEIHFGNSDSSQIHQHEQQQLPLLQQHSQHQQMASGMQIIRQPQIPHEHQHQQQSQYVIQQADFGNFNGASILQFSGNAVPQTSTCVQGQLILPAQLQSIQANGGTVFVVPSQQGNIVRSVCSQQPQIAVTSVSHLPMISVSQQDGQQHILQAIPHRQFNQHVVQVQQRPNAKELFGSRSVVNIRQETPVVRQLLSQPSNAIRQISHSAYPSTSYSGTPTSAPRGRQRNSQPRAAPRRKNNAQNTVGSVLTTANQLAAKSSTDPAQNQTILPSSKGELRLSKEHAMEVAQLSAEIHKLESMGEMYRSSQVNSELHDLVTRRARIFYLTLAEQHDDAKLLSAASTEPGAAPPVIRDRNCNQYQYTTNRTVHQNHVQATGISYEQPQQTLVYSAQNPTSMYASSQQFPQFSTVPQPLKRGSYDHRLVSVPHASQTGAGTRTSASSSIFDKNVNAGHRETSTRDYHQESPASSHPDFMTQESYSTQSINPTGPSAMQDSTGPPLILQTKDDLAAKALEKSQARGKRFGEYFARMDDSLINGDLITPFKSKKDVLERLLPYHVFFEPDLTDDTLDLFDTAQMRQFVNLDYRMKQIQCRGRQIFFRQAMEHSYKGENLLLLALDCEYERRNLERERQEAASNPEQYRAKLSVIPEITEQHLERRKNELDAQHGCNKLSMNFDHTSALEEEMRLRIISPRPPSVPYNIKNFEEMSCLPETDGNVVVETVTVRQRITVEKDRTEIMADAELSDHDRSVAVVDNGVKMSEEHENVSTNRVPFNIKRNVPFKVNFNKPSLLREDASPTEWIHSVPSDKSSQMERNIMRNETATVGQRSTVEENSMNIAADGESSEHDRRTAFVENDIGMTEKYDNIPSNCVPFKAMSKVSRRKDIPLKVNFNITSPVGKGASSAEWGHTAANKKVPQTDSNVVMSETDSIEQRNTVEKNSMNIAADGESSEHDQSTAFVENDIGMTGKYDNIPSNHVPFKAMSKVSRRKDIPRKVNFNKASPVGKVASPAEWRHTAPNKKVPQMDSNVVMSETDSIEQRNTVEKNSMNIAADGESSEHDQSTAFVENDIGMTGKYDNIPSNHVPFKAMSKVSRRKDIPRKVNFNKISPVEKGVSPAEWGHTTANKKVSQTGRNVVMGKTESVEQRDTVEENSMNIAADGESSEHDRRTAFVENDIGMTEKYDNILSNRVPFKAMSKVSRRKDIPLKVNFNKTSPVGKGASSAVWGHTAANKKVPQMDSNVVMSEMVEENSMNIAADGESSKHDRRTAFVENDIGMTEKYDNIPSNCVPFKAMSKVSRRKDIPLKVNFNKISPVGKGASPAEWGHTGANKKIKANASDDIRSASHVDISASCASGSVDDCVTSEKAAVQSEPNHGNKCRNKDLIASQESENEKDSCKIDGLKMRIKVALIKRYKKDRSRAGVSNDRSNQTREGICTKLSHLDRTNYHKCKVPEQVSGAVFDAVLPSVVTKMKKRGKHSKTNHAIDRLEEFRRDETMKQSKADQKEMTNRKCDDIGYQYVSQIVVGLSKLSPVKLLLKRVSRAQTTSHHQSDSEGAKRDDVEASTQSSSNQIEQHNSLQPEECRSRKKKLSACIAWNPEDRCPPKVPKIVLRLDKENMQYQKNYTTGDVSSRLSTNSSPVQETSVNQRSADHREQIKAASEPSNKSMSISATGLNVTQRGVSSENEVNLGTSLCPAVEFSPHSESSDESGNDSLRAQTDQLLSCLKSTVAPNPAIDAESVNIFKSFNNNGGSVNNLLLHEGIPLNNKDIHVWARR